MLARENDGMPQRISLDALAREQLELAAGAGGGHTAHTVYGGHEKVLRQTVIAMVRGSELSEHENPCEATVLVLHGRVRMSAGELAWEGSRGDLITVPDGRPRPGGTAGPGRQPRKPDHRARRPPPPRGAGRLRRAADRRQAAVSADGPAMARAARWRRPF